MEQAEKNLRRRKCNCSSLSLSSVKLPSRRRVSMRQRIARRQELPPNLPRVERIQPCTLDQRVCKRCGKETVVIGYEESSQLDVERRSTSYWSRNERSGLAGLVRISASCQHPAATDHRLASDRIVIKNP